MLFANQRKLELSIPAKDAESNATNIAYLVHRLCKNVMKDHRKELFMLDDTV